MIKLNPFSGHSLFFLFLHVDVVVVPILVVFEIELYTWFGNQNKIDSDFFPFKYFIVYDSHYTHTPHHQYVYYVKYVSKSE